MSLALGTRLGPYEVTAQIGVGGMGEVYRATDTNLARQVAIKVLPAAVAADAERLARFDREAKTLAALNHPNIATIYGLEKSAGGIALVMELVEGPTLADRIGRGPMPIDEALPIAKQIAEALEAAHEQGIIHRDLKPANITVRSDGTVKVLDFGLAKALDPAGARSPETANSPTITSPAMTAMGVILGTAGYMSPEQARGKPVDRRADVWAFGCVLYEMLTGRRVFTGEGVSDTIAAVLRAEVDWTPLPPAVSPVLRTYLQRCLSKEPQQRIGDMQTMRLALEGALDITVLSRAQDPQPANLRRTGALTLAAALTGAVVTGVAVWFAVRPDPPRLTRLVLPTDGAAAFTPGVVSRDLIVTSHGDRVIYRAGDQLMVRALDAVQPTALTVVGTPSGLFGSPDGQWIGFSSGGWLRKVATTGGASVAVTAVDSGFRGATWSASGTIVFATASSTGLASVAADGGGVTVLTTPDAAHGEVDHLWPEFLPDGRAVLFTITAPSGGLDAGRIAVADLETRQVTVLPLHGTRPRYISSGHLLYGANGAIQVVAFDAARRRVVGTPSPVLTPGPILPSGDMQLDVTANGTLVYAPPVAATGPYSLVWVDRTGQETPMAGLPPRPFAQPQLSRDGLRLMLSDVGQGDIRGLNVASPTLYRITDDAASDLSSTWLADGRVVFASNRSGGYRLYVQSGDGPGEAARLIDSQTTQIGPSATPDGSGVVFTEVTVTGGGGVRLLSLETGQVTSLVDTPSVERAGTVSPDGRWLAFESNRSDRFEVYVQRFPSADAAGVIPISTRGGVQPRWGPGAKELFYVAPDGAIMAVTVGALGATWAASRPTRLFSGSYSTRYNQAVWASPDYDTHDGTRFLMLKNEAETPEGSGSAQIMVVQNWREELKRLVPMPQANR